MHDRFGDTIAAIATPLGTAGVAVIRISGAKAQTTLSAIFKSRVDFEPRYFYYGKFTDPKTGDVLDDGCAVYFPSPKSFTGEECVELHCHSNAVILKRMMGALLSLGLRLADGGEFTRRAFINGKMDLTQAESLIDLIEAKTELGRQVALQHLNGGLYHRLIEVRKRVMALLEHVEASIDFPDEVEPIEKTFFDQEIAEILNFVGAVLSQQDFGKMVYDGVKCLIVGYPNTGKSSLLNALLGEERAIVTDIPGTTRDFIEVKLELGGLTFDLIDTAGYRETTDPVEAMGIERIQSLLPTAHAVFWLVDVSRSLHPEELALGNLLNRTDAKAKYLLCNKVDLKDFVLSLEETVFSEWKMREISAKTGHGLSELKTTLITDFCEKTAALDKDFICNIRQIHCFSQMQQNLLNIQKSRREGFIDDVLAIDLRAVISAIGEITGDEITEEVLDGVFSRFCVGK